jgi:N-methylhydantoinase A
VQPGAVAAIDVGGTFTDIALWQEGGGLRTHKLLTNSDGAAHGMKDGIDAMGVVVGAVVHGTTLVTNALIERRGAAVGLITTDGYRDVLEIATELRYDTFDLGLRRPEPLVPQHRRLAIEERVGADGTIVTQLDEEAVVEAGRGLVSEGVASIAVAFFNSWANPDHEQLAIEALAHAFPGTPVSISSDVCNEIGEYERFSTTAANAFVKPLVSSYLSELSNAFEGSLFLML